MAIAACPESVVADLSREMDAQARKLSTRNRPLDLPVLQYVAAVDLLSGHRSYSAAQVLLLHLINQAVEGVPRRALTAALARSPNTALVDGLLSAVETPTTTAPHAVAAAAEVLGLRRERAAVPAITALTGHEFGPTVRRAAIAALGRIGDRSVVDIIEPAVHEPPLAEQAALALLMLGDRRGVDFHVKALDEGRRDLSSHPGELVGRYGGPSHLLVLIPAAQGDDEMALGAAQGLGLMGDPRGVPTLLNALSTTNTRIREVASGALEILTGHQEDLDEPGFRGRWHQWWDEHRGRFPEGVRHRGGKPFDAGILIDQMSHRDSWTRRTAYDELVITTGAQLPFDSDGPWRVQTGHLARWRRWWMQHRGEFPPGHWYLDAVRND